MAGGEFGPDVRCVADVVVVVLTQSWCPQWKMMAAMMEGLPELPHCALFHVEYDRESWFEEFRAFKEEVLGNGLIPYLRYYRGGCLSRTSNYLDRASFLRIIES